MHHKRITIYTLTNPQNSLIYYVGATTNTLMGRLSSKHSCPTSKMLQKIGVKPVIEMVDECDGNNRRLTESYWIQQFKAWGFRIENKHYNTNRFFTGYQKPRKAKPPHINQSSRRSNILIGITVDDNQIKAASKHLSLPKETIQRYLLGSVSNLFTADRIIRHFNHKQQRKTA